MSGNRTPPRRGSNGERPGRRNRGPNGGGPRNRQTQRSSAFSYRPPRNDQYDSNRHDGSYDNRPRDSYRPNYNDDPGYMHFTGDSYYPRDTHHSGNNHRDFSYRNQPANLPDFSAPPPSAPRADRRNRRPAFKKAKAADRDLLRRKRSPTPEQYKVMAGGPNRFKQESELEASDAAEPALKKRDPDVRPDGTAIPKWSNPDPYTALPPPSETTGKRGDVLDIIRRARAQPAGGKSMESAGDFISLDDDDGGDAAPRQHGDAEAEDDDDDAPPRQHKHTEGSSEDRDEPSSKRSKGLKSGDSVPAFRLPKVQEGQKFSHLDHLHPNRAMETPSSSSLFDRVERTRPRPQSNVSAPVLASGSEQIIEQVQRAIKRTLEIAENERAVLEDRPTRKQARAGSNKSSAHALIPPHWRAASQTNATPWFHRHKAERMDAKFHDEVVAFYHYVRPSQKENDARHALVNRLKSWFSKKGQGWQVHCFGSFAAGVYLPAADMDLVVYTQKPSNKPPRMKKSMQANLVRDCARILRQSQGQIQPGSLVTIPHAKVPIVKYRDYVTQLKVDVSFDNDSGLIANNTYESWKSEYPQMVSLVTVVKQFLAMRELNDASMGGLGGLSTSCLVISVLQHMPNRNQMALGQLFMSFLDFYGNHFDLREQGIRINPPEYFRKKEWTGPVKGDFMAKPTLLLVDPNRPDNNLAAPSYSAKMVFDCFRDAFNLLNERMMGLERGERPDDSILGEVLGGNYEQYEQQRDLLDPGHRDR